MSNILRDSAFGQAVRLVTRRKLFLYPEEEPGFEADRYYSSSSLTGSPSAIDISKPSERAGEITDSKHLNEPSNSGRTFIQETWKTGYLLKCAYRR